MAIYKDVETLELVAYQGESEEFDKGVKFILEKLDALPTADVVEVVRCKECKYGTIAYGCLKRGKGLRGDFVEPTDFCSYGERRDT